MCIDQRGFAYIVQAEAAEFLKSNQLLLNQTVKFIHYNSTGVTVQTTGGYNLTADHVLVTFSVGVLQHTDVVFDPPLPDWKHEAINNMEMVSNVLKSLFHSSPNADRRHTPRFSCNSTRHFGSPLRYLHFPFRCRMFDLDRRRWVSMRTGNGGNTPSGKVLIMLASSQGLGLYSSRSRYVDTGYRFPRLILDSG